MQTKSPRIGRYGLASHQVRDLKKTGTQFAVIPLSQVPRDPLLRETERPLPRSLEKIRLRPRSRAHIRIELSGKRGK